MLSGAAGGIGAIFRAPLGGALFVAEVLYKSTALEYAAVVPGMIASITAYTVFAAIFGQGLAFNTPRGLVFNNIAELPFYVVFAVVCSVVGYIYVTVFYGLRNQLFRRLPIPDAIKPAIGGLMLGAIALWLPQIMAGGYGWIQEAIDGRMTIVLLLVLCFAKILATSVTISSGGQRRRLRSLPVHWCHAWWGVRSHLQSAFPRSHPTPGRPLCSSVWAASLRA